MPEDETYRPQKKPIDPSEVDKAQPQDSLRPAEVNQAQLDAMAEMRANIAKEVGEEPAAAPDQGGFEIKGNMPPQFKEALQKNRQSEGATERMAVQPRQRPTPETEMRAVGNDRLTELIDIIDRQAVYEPIKLPSRGVFYDGEDGPQDGVIHIKPMTGEEEQILATPRFVRKGQAINMIFNRCMQENYNTENFLTQDRTYMLIYLRGISYTPEYDVEVRDPETDQTFATTIDLNSLYVDFCPQDFSVNDLQGQLPSTGFSFTYRLARGGDEQKIQEYRDRRAKNFDTAGQADDTLLFRTALLVNDIEGLKTDLEISALLKKLPINDVAYLRDLTSNPPFGVDTTVSITSPYTLQDFEIELPLEANFFFPRAKKNQSSV
jgi:hypothetical protein